MILASFFGYFLVLLPHFQQLGVVLSVCNHALDLMFVVADSRPQDWLDGFGIPSLETDALGGKNHLSAGNASSAQSAISSGAKVDAPGLGGSVIGLFLIFFAIVLAPSLWWAPADNHGRPVSASIYSLPA